MQGPPGMSGYEIVSDEEEYTETQPASTRALIASAQCPAGKRAMGGGGSGRIIVGNVVVNLGQIVDSFPFLSGSESSWQTSIGKGDGRYLAPGETIAVTVYAVCVNVAT